MSHLTIKVLLMIPQQILRLGFYEALKRVAMIPVHLTSSFGCGWMVEFISVKMCGQSIVGPVKGEPEPGSCL